MGVFSTRSVAYKAESAFCENASSPSSNDWDKRIPVLSCDVTLEQERMSDNSLQNRQNESRPGYLGIRSASLTFETYLPGHNSTSSGSLTETWVQDLLSDALGGGSVDQAGTTVNAASSATSVTFTSTTNYAVGEMVRIGAKGDGRADGQAGVLATVASPCTFLTAFPGTPSGSDVIYAGQMSWPTETPSASKRFCVAWDDTSGAAYHLMGGQLSGLALTITPGQLPTIKWTYQFAYWAKSTTDLSAIALESCNTQPVAGGSVFIQTVGTTTRAVYSPAEMTLEIDLGLAPKLGPAAGQASYANINGWTRTRCVPTFTMVAPWATTWDSTYDADGSATTHQHILVTLSTGDGSRNAAFYMPRAYIVSPKPTVTENNSQVYQTISWRGREGTVTTNDLTRSAIRFSMG